MWRGGCYVKWTEFLKPDHTFKYTPILVAVIFSIAGYRTQLFAVTTQHLGIKSVLSTAAVTH